MRRLLLVIALGAAVMITLAAVPLVKPRGDLARGAGVRPGGLPLCTGWNRCRAANYRCRCWATRRVSSPCSLRRAHTVPA
jgi:hypothetical protein